MVGLLWRALVVAFVGALAVTATLAAPEGATAQTLTPFEELRANPQTSQYLDDYYSKILKASERSPGWETTTNNMSNAQRNVLYNRLYRARVGARLLPKILTVGSRLTIAGTAAYVGWRIYQHYSGGATPSTDLWLDNDKLGKNSLANPCSYSIPCHMPDWTNGAAAGPNIAWGVPGGVYWEITNNYCPTSVGTPCAALHLRLQIETWYGYWWVSGTAQQQGGSSQPDATSAGDWRFVDESLCKNVAGSSSQVSGQTPATPGYCNLNTVPNEVLPAQSSLSHKVMWDTVLRVMSLTNGKARPIYLTNAAGPYSLDGAAGTYKTGIKGALASTWDAVYPGVLTGYRRMGLFVSADDFDVLVNPQWDNTPLTTTPDSTTDYTVPAPYTQPGDIGTEADTNSSLDELDSECGRQFVNWVLEPGIYTFDPTTCTWGGVATFPLLAPRVNETYSDYLDRLRDAGWLGTATTEQATSTTLDPAMGPEGVVSVRVGTRVYTPGQWPGTLPLLNVGTALHVLHNPQSVPEAPGGGEPLPSDPGVGEPPAVAPLPPPVGPFGAWCPACPPVDFTPLTGLDYGGTFPFGVVPWLDTWLDGLTTTADAPVFAFDFSSTSTPVGSYNLGQYEVDLAVLDPYMSVIRTILAWVVWIGAVWWFGSYLIGFRAGGDPGAAVDEAWS